MGAKNLRLVMDSTDHFIAVSRAAKNNLVINYKVPEEKITVVYGAVKVPVEGIHRKTEIPEMYNLPETNFIVGAAGRVDHIKGYDLFIDIAEEVCHGHKKKDIIFVWAGSFGRGKRESVNEKIYAKNLIGNVFFTGELKEPFGLYALFDVWLIPSREDTFPRVILEAAVLGKPSLCFEDSGGGIEFVEDKKNGILIPDFDIHAAAEAIIGLCADRKWLNELGENAKRKVLSGFTINQQGENYFHIINRFLERE
jgi:glycosyltransferase involved in cell wall biosynthesis